jgi:TetR/AcrR family transcriptional regulator, cholesterol catabolism regulator
MARIRTSKDNSHKDIILRGAASLFYQKGFEGATMRGIAESIGIEAPSLYNHIKNKDELLQDICFDMANKFTQQIDQLNLVEQAAMEKIRQVLKYQISMMLQEFEKVYVANHEWKKLQEPYLSNFYGQRRHYEKKFAAIIEQGMTNGEIKKMDAYVVVLTMLSAVRGVEFWHRNNKNVSPETLENDMIEQLLKGIHASA